MAAGVFAPTQDQEQPQDEATQDPKAHAARLRAMVILKISPYLWFPDRERNTTQPFRVAVVGADALGKALHKFLPKKQVEKRPIKVEDVGVKAAATADRRAFDVMYIAEDVPQAALDKIVARHAKLATVLICEREGFAQHGGGIQLFVQKNNLRFEINKGALEKQEVRVNPHLLKLSTKGPTR